MRDGSEKRQLAKAPLLSALMTAVPRATLPSQTAVEVRVIRGTATAPSGTTAVVRVVGLRGRAGGAENAEHLHLAGAGVLESVHDAGREVDAGAGAQRRRLAADVQRAFAFEHVDDLVVVWK